MTSTTHHTSQRHASQQQASLGTAHGPEGSWTAQLTDQDDHPLPGHGWKPLPQTLAVLRNQLSRAAQRIDSPLACVCSPEGQLYRAWNEGADLVIADQDMDRWRVASALRTLHDQFSSLHTPGRDLPGTRPRAAKQAMQGPEAHSRKRASKDAQGDAARAAGPGKRRGAARQPGARRGRPTLPAAQTAATQNLTAQTITTQAPAAHARAAQARATRQSP